MASFSSKIVSSLLFIFNTKNKIRHSSNEKKYSIPRLIYSKLKIEEKQIMGRRVFYLSPKKISSRALILYLHGGAYVHSFSVVHWLFFRKIIEKTGCSIIAPDYPLAPKHTYKDSFDLVLPILIKKVSELGSKNVILMGDSSGGGFALALAQKLKNEGLENVNQIILLSPWLDITMKNQEIYDLAPKDPMLNVYKLIQAGEQYSGDDDTNNYMLSPINGPIDGLGKISVFIGTHDILFSDSKRLHDKAKKSNVRINYFEYQKMIHVWMLLGLPESRKAISQIIKLVNDN